MARGNIYKALLGKLEKQLGFLPEGTKLPPEQELAEKFGVSKPTLRRALAELAVRGIIVKQLLPINALRGRLLGGRIRVVRHLFFPFRFLVKVIC